MRKIRVTTKVEVQAWIEQEVVADVYIDDNGDEPYIDSFEFIEWNHPMLQNTIDTDTMHNNIDVEDVLQRLWRAVKEQGSVDKNSKPKKGI